MPCLSTRTAAFTIAFALACALPVLAQDASTPFPGASGMIYLPAQNAYLCAQDVKGPAASGHFGLLRVDALGHVTYSELATDWGGMLPGSDIEGLSAIPGRPDEFLAVESGYWEGQYGRILHLRLSWPLPTPQSGQQGAAPESVVATPALIPAVSAIGAVQLPVLSDEVEGIAAVARGEEILLILSLRGGKTPYSSGWLRWGWLDLGAGTLSLYEQAGKGIEISWPEPSWYPWSRSITDLYVDSQGMLWASGADDAGDAGPFRSYIQCMGKVDSASEWPIMNYMPQRLIWRLDGLKVEAIAAPSLPGSVLSFATDDEGYGGIIRPLPPATPPAQQPYYRPEY